MADVKISELPAGAASDTDEMVIVDGGATKKIALSALSAYLRANGWDVTGTVNATSFTGDGSQLTGIDALPDQSGHANQFLQTNGSTADWVDVDALPDQTGHADQFLKTNGTTADWATVDAGASGGGSDQVFWENDTTVTTNYTITSGKNAVTAGPVTINDGVTVTIPDGSTWSIV